MNAGLKPCPLCGSTNLVGSTDVGIRMDHEDCHAPDGVVATVYCDDCGCQVQAKVPCGGGYDSANDKVFEKWNRRAERTCRMTFDCREYRYRCSRCGCLNETYRDVDGKFCAPDYCSHCGARAARG